MKTSFSPDQLCDPDFAASEAVIRKCVHCGFCTATCPTYALLGDELDSPRGRIYLMKEMLENEQQPSAEVVTHIDRCLSCLSCMTTCPSGVNYMHLVDHARVYIEQRYERPLHERLIRGLLARTLPHPRRMRLALRLAKAARWLEPILDRNPTTKALAAMLRLAPQRVPAPAPTERAPATAPRRGRVVLLQGCAEGVLRPEIRTATVSLLTRAGFDVEFAAGEGCCGALTWHLGRKSEGLASARRNVEAWRHEMQRGLDAIVVTTSGCGTTIKDYGFMLREDPEYAEDAAKVSALTKDITELLIEAGLPAARAAPPLDVVYQSPCSMRHGQKITDAPLDLLLAAGFRVREPAEPHLCCGSAGTYNILQPDLAGKLGDRKAANLSRLNPDVIATGNVGCATQLQPRVGAPVVHTVELLDWATGGDRPAVLSTRPIPSLVNQNPRARWRISDARGLFGEAAPGVAAVIDDVVVELEDAVRQPVVADAEKAVRSRHRTNGWQGKSPPSGPEAAIAMSELVRRSSAAFTGGRHARRLTCAIARDCKRNGDYPVITSQNFPATEVEITSFISTCYGRLLAEIWCFRYRRTAA